jgi:hypothetical protein
MTDRLSLQQENKFKPKISANIQEKGETAYFISQGAALIPLAGGFNL